MTGGEDDARGRGLRLQTLVRLRWLAVIGQTLAVLGVAFGFGFPLPLGACFFVITLSAWLNIFLTLRRRPASRIAERPAALLLAYDIAQLALLLYLTGGLQNPFAFLFLVPVTVSATSFSMRTTVLLGALALTLASLLALYHQPLPWFAGDALVLPHIYVAGVWASLISGTVFAAIYTGRIALEARQMSDALAATELVLAREQQLSALDGLAAAAAHELGTPLATIALVAKELKREVPSESPFTEDLDLLVSQAARCREILARLSDREAQSDAIFARVRLALMLEEIIEPLRASGIVITVTREGDADEPVIARNPAISYGLANLIENAVDFAEARVDVAVRWGGDGIAVVIRDDGPGFAQHVFDRLGDPFVTSRKGDGAPVPADDGHEGMGLGFFIAKTLLERSGAVVTLANRRPPAHGADVRISWPKDAIAAGPG